jgi:hypothetical protein
VALPSTSTQHPYPRSGLGHEPGGDGDEPPGVGENASVPAALPAAVGTSCTAPRRAALDRTAVGASLRIATSFLEPTVRGTAGA